MKATLFALLSLLAFPSIAGIAQAQPAEAAPGQGRGGGRGGRGGVPARLDLATAQRIMDAAVASATASGLNVAIAIVDANGDLVLLKRLDGAPAQGVTSAQGKARAAILFGKSTNEVAQAAAAGQAVTATITPSGVGATNVNIQQGGLPFVRNGQVIAGVGVGGASSAQDEVIAQAGIDAAM